MLLGTTSPVAVPPPPGFRPVIGKVTFVERLGTQLSGKGNTSAQKLGFKFEKDVKKALHNQYSSDFSPGARFRFVDHEGARVCEMDGIVVRKNYVVLFEVKAQHTPDAWHQVRELYEPVLATFFQRVIIPVEIVKSYDGYTPFPEATFPLFSFAELENWIPNFPASSAQFGVFLWPRVKWSK